VNSKKHINFNHTEPIENFDRDAQLDKNVKNYLKTNNGEFTFEADMDADGTIGVKTEKIKIIDVESVHGENFGRYEPTVSTVYKDSINFTVSNFSNKNQDINLFYNKFGDDNALSNFGTKNKKQYVPIMYKSSPFAAVSFMNPDGTQYRSSNEIKRELPIGFFSSVDIDIQYNYKGVSYTLGSSTLSAKTTFASASDQINRGIKLNVLANTGDTLPDNFNGSSTFGIVSFFGGATGGLSGLGQDRPYIIFNQYYPHTLPASDGYIIFEEINVDSTGFLPSKTEDQFPTTFMLNLKSDGSGFNVCLELRDITTPDNESYVEFVNSLNSQQIKIRDFRQTSVGRIQEVNSPILFVEYDTDGNQEQMSTTQVIDPYQAQAVSNNYQNVLLDGQTYAIYKSIENSKVDIQLDYIKSGIVTGDEIKMIEESLLNEKEKEYLNLDGNKKEKKMEHGKMNQSGQREGTDTNITASSDFTLKKAVAGIIIVSIIGLGIFLIMRKKK
jgi:hypothetical protein